MALPWWHDPPTDPASIITKLEARIHMLKSPSEEGQALRKLFQSLKGTYQKVLREAKQSCPIAFFKPSYEQALLLNAWVYGITFPICFASNRIGKTTAFVVNALLWILPNDPKWIIFQPYVDHLGRYVQVLPRPPLRTLLHLQKFYEEFPHLAGNPKLSMQDPHNYSRIVTSQQEAPGLFRVAYPAAPIQGDISIWLGAPDKEWHRSIMMRRWKDWLPPHTIEQWNITECFFRLTTRSTTNPKPIQVEVSCKSYESRDEKWSGDAVTGIMLSEGFSPEILSEVKNRVAPNAFASWDYTPVEARNVGRKVQLAYKVFQGKEELPLRAHVFTKFRVADAPAHIIPESKRKDMIRMWANKAEGTARIEGDFFSSSRQLLANLDRNHHCLQESFQSLQQRIPNLLLFRSIDPGFDHPTAVCWAALAPNQVWYVYRFLSKRGLTIGERCRQIIEMSHNSREKVQYGPKNLYHSFREVHTTPESEAFVATVADYHVFQTDQTTGQSFAINYALEGLPLMESTHIGPEQRAVQLDSKLDPRSYPYHAHPETHKPPGAGVYFLINEPGVADAVDKLEELFWDMLQGGPNKGESKDTVPSHGDDELDALCQLTSGPFYWHPSIRAQRNTPRDREPELQLMEASYQHATARHHLPDREIVTSQQQDLLAAYAVPSPMPGRF